MSTAALLERLSRVCLKAALLLCLVRVIAPAPDTSDPPDMHAFYHAWLQPPWWLMAILLIAGIAIPLIPELYHAALDALERKL